MTADRMTLRCGDWHYEPPKVRLWFRLSSGQRITVWCERDCAEMRDALLAAINRGLPTNDHVGITANLRIP